MSFWVDFGVFVAHAYGLGGLELPLLLFGDLKGVAAEADFLLLPGDVIAQVLGAVDFGEACHGGSPRDGRFLDESIFAGL